MPPAESVGSCCGHWQWHWHWHCGSHWQCHQPSRLSAGSKFTGNFQVAGPLALARAQAGTGSLSAGGADQPALTLAEAAQHDASAVMEVLNTKLLSLADCDADLLAVDSGC